MLITFFETFWAILVILAALGRLGGCLRIVLVGLWLLLGSLGDLLGPPWAPFGVSWGPLAHPLVVFWGSLGDPWGVFGTSLGRLGRQERKSSKKAPKGHLILERFWGVFW